MKQIITIGVIVVIFIFLSLYINNYLDTSSKTISNYIQNVETFSKRNDWSGSVKELKSANSLWNNNKNKWAVLIEHQEIDKIDLALNKMSSYLDVKDESMLVGEGNNLKLLLQHIPNIYKLEWKNVF